MRTRYKNGKPIASIYSSSEHGILREQIDKDALKVINKLLDSGYETYLVGGAVRDLMLGKTPKDFDVVTQATPRKVHKLFSNSRIIGKRFRLVHIVFGDKIIEVSTFRSNIEHEDKNDNVFGTIEEDSSRRDFTINSLYYNIIDETLIDYNNSIKDFRDRKIHAVIPINKIFKEDPVRMIRAIKYSVTTGFKLSRNIKFAIKRNSSELIKVSNSRITEEVHKILMSGYSEKIMKQFCKYKLLVFILPCISVYSKYPELYRNLSLLDSLINESKTFKQKKIEEADAIYYLTKSFIIPNDELTTNSEKFKDFFRQIKILISPNTPPNYEIENATKKYMSSIGLSLAKQKPITAKR